MKRKKPIPVPDDIRPEDMKARDDLTAARRDAKAGADAIEQAMQQPAEPKPE